MRDLSIYEIVDGNCTECELGDVSFCHNTFTWLFQERCRANNGNLILKKKEVWVTCTRGNIKVGDTVRWRGEDPAKCEVQYIHKTRPWFVLTWFSIWSGLKEGEYPMDEYEILLKE